MPPERSFGTEISANRRRNYEFTPVQKAVMVEQLSSGSHIEKSRPLLIQHPQQHMQSSNDGKATKHWIIAPELDVPLN
jgi:hypothetical protein